MARTTLEMVLAFFISGEVYIFALIDGGDESFHTIVTNVIGNFLTSIQIFPVRLQEIIHSRPGYR